MSPGEPPEVGAAAAVSLGRMKASTALEALTSAADEIGRGNQIYESCQWAIAQITGDEQPVSLPRRKVSNDPFLKSIAR